MNWNIIAICKAQPAILHLLNCCSTIGPGEMGEAEVEIKAKRAGDCVVISSFECKEMGDIQGQRTYKVKKE